MFVHEGTHDNWVDDWENHPDLGGSVTGPDLSWSTIERLIYQLDGKRRTSVSLLGPKECYMMIGGGLRRKYIVYVTCDNLTFNQLISPNESLREVVEQAIGGQWSEYPARICVDLDQVLTAARIYADSGKLADSLTWEEY